MRKLPSKYSDIEKSLPQRVVLNNPVRAYYTNPVTGKTKDVKISADTTFVISALPEKQSSESENPQVQSDIVATKAIVKGKSVNLYANFNYKDLVDNALMVEVGGKYKSAKRSLLILGVPRQYFIAGIGVLMILGGVYFYKKKAK